MSSLFKIITSLTSILCLTAQSIALNDPFTVPTPDSIRSIQECRILFTSQKDLAKELIALIDQENKSIKAAVYCLMHRQIAVALMRASRRGVKVEILVDPFSVKKSSPLKKMVEAGVPLFVWSPEKQKTKNEKKSLMHDKFCVFGNEKVWTGSFNFTLGAVTNEENAIVIEDLQVAKCYSKEFERLKSKGAISYDEYIKHSPSKK